MQKIIDRLAKWLSTPEQQQQIPKVISNKFTVGSELSEEDLHEQMDAICKQIGFGDKYAEPAVEKDGVFFMIFYEWHDNEYDETYSIHTARIYCPRNEFARDFLVVDSQLDLDEIRAAIAKLKVADK